MLRFASRVRAFGVASALAITSLGMVAPASASESDSPITWEVQTGNFIPPGSPDYPPAQEVTTFYPARIVVHPGDEVTFTQSEGHTVTFNGKPFRTVPNFAYADPAFPFGPTGTELTFANRTPNGKLLNSGQFGGGIAPGVLAPPTFTLTIGSDAAGASGQDRTARANGGGQGDSRGITYQYFCMFHRDMTGFITVLPSGSRLPSTNDENLIRAAAAKAADIAAGKRATRSASRNVRDNRVAAGLGLTSVQGAGANSILAFAPATIEINAGQSVTWINKDLNAPHTVTFGEEKLDENGQPLIAPYGGPSVTSASDQVSSGFLISQQLIDYLNASSLLPSGFVVTRQVTYTFPKAGTYKYICALHDTLGMFGWVVVHANNHGGGGGSG